MKRVIFLIFKSLIKISINAFLAGIIVYGSLQILASWVDMHTFIGVFIQGVGAGTMGLLTYLILSIVFKLDEIYIVKKILKKFILFFKNGKNT